MVHVPFFNIDLPEPKLGALLPDTVGAIVQGTHKVLGHAHDAVFPPTPEELHAFERDFEQTIPREFDRVRKRYAEGKIANDEQLSSELEDASFDWYRRQLRTSVIGATDEEMEDVAARKLGLSKPSVQAAVQERFTADKVAQAGGVDIVGEMHEAALLQELREQQLQQMQQLDARVRHVEELRRQVRTQPRQALGAITNASGGLLLGMLLFKGSILTAQRLFRRKKPAQRPQPQQQRRQAAPAAAAPTQPRAQAAASAATAAAGAAARQQPAVQQQQPQAQAQAAGKAQEAAPAATSTRKTRAPVKKR